MGARRWLRSPLRFVKRARREIAQDVDEEIAFHLEMREAALMRAGMSAGAAAEQARREFGDEAALRRELRREDQGLDHRRVRGWRRDELRQDIRFALRALVREPRFVLLALSTLVVGIGAAVAMFTVVNAVLLRPLPWPHADRLVRVSPGQNFNITLVARLAQQAPSLEQSSGIAQFGFTLSGVGDPVELTAQVVEPAYFELAGGVPARGRAFTESERDGAVVVISDALWRGRFGADPDIIGRLIPLDGYSGSATEAGPASREVIGVMPAGFEPPLTDVGSHVDLWIPLRPARATVAADSSWYVNAFLARLRPGATFADASAQLRSAMAAERAVNAGIGEDAVRTASVVPLLDAIVGGTRRVLWLMLAAVGLVLVLACTNLANLLLARADRRSHELATRAALGATRGRMIRELLTESAVLAACGALGGVVMAKLLLTLLQVGRASELPRADALAIDARVIAFTIAVTAVTLLGFALLPALRATAGELRPALGSSARTQGRTPAGRRFGLALMTTEVALAMVLVTGAGLLLGTLRSLYSVDPGMAAGDVLTARVAAPPARYSGADARAYYGALEERLAALPGVRSVGAIHLLPMTVGNWSFPYLAKGQQPPAGRTLPSANFRVIRDGWFDALDIRIVAGRAFDRTDVGGADVGIINETLAGQLWPGESAIGREILLFGSMPFRVVGVVADVRQHGLDQAPLPEMYRPFHQWTLSTMVLALEVDGEPADYADAVRQAVWSVDADVPIDVRPLRDIVTDSLARRRFFAGVLTFFGALAIVLGGIGVYGVLSFIVNARMAELSVRSALGATRSGLLRAALGGPLAAVALGILAGSLAAIMAGRLLQSLLFGVAPGDLRILVAAAVVLACMGIIAGWVPALRAARTEPARLLRG